MLKQRADEFSQAKGKTADGLKLLVRDGEDLLKAAANASGAGFTAARAKFAEKVTSARARFADVSQPVVRKARQVDGYVHGSPWTAVGVAAVAGMLIGFLAAKR